MAAEDNSELAFRLLMGLAFAICVAGAVLLMAAVPEIPPVAVLLALTIVLSGWTLSLFQKRPRAFELFLWMTVCGAWVAYYRTVAYPLLNQAFSNNYQYLQILF